MSDRPPARVVIQSVEPELECGRVPIKRVVGETVEVTANIVCDGHDAIASVIRYRHQDDELWTEIPMESLVDDQWRAQFPVDRLGRYIYSITSWVDPFQIWYKDF